MKKLVLWTLYTGFVGILIFGAINRTSTKLGDNDSFPNGNATEISEEPKNQAIGRNGNGYEQDENIPPLPDESTHTEEDLHEGQETEHYWATIKGVISSLSSQEMLILTDNGQGILVSRRPWRFAQEQGFTSQVGDQITLDGFYENGDFETAILNNLSTNQTVYLRDETGHPLWAAGGENGNE